MGTKHIPISITNSTMPEKGQYSNLLRGADHLSKRFFDKFYWTAGIKRTLNNFDQIKNVINSE